ncbi:MAG: RNA polymerase sigma factor [Bacteroidota bacterium]
MVNATHKTDMETADYANQHRELVEGCLRRDRQAQFALYQQYAKGMYNVCKRMLNNAHDAEDVLQVAFVDVFGRIDSFRFQSSIGAWIKRIVVNRCIDHLKRKRLLTEELEVERHDFQLEVVDEGYDPKILSIDSVKSALSRLSEGYRVVVSLYLFEGYDHEEIGEILGISSSTSKSQYHRGKKRLRELLVA